MLAWIKRNKYLLGFLIAVIAIGYFGYGYYKSSTEVKETVRTATVEYGHLSDSISATSVITNRPSSPVFVYTSLWTGLISVPK